MSEDTRDRRRFYRIKDRVSLNYRVVQPDDLDREISKTSRRQRELSELRNAVHAVDARLEVINMNLARENPLVAEALNLFQRKIALHERMLGIDDYDDRVFSQAREVNLSASGVAFEAETPLSEGTFLKMELVTYPEHNYIVIFSRVVNCKQLGDGSSAGYHVAVEFRDISEEDEQRIVNHIFKKQAEEIKRSRLAEDENDMEITEENVSHG